MDELVEMIRWLHKRWYQVTVVGHSYGGLLAHLALMRLEEPNWCNAVLIEPSHLHETVRDPKQILGASLGIENLRNRHLLSPFGGELLDVSISPHAFDGQHHPHIDAVKRERRSGRCVRATMREFTTLAWLLFDSTIRSTGFSKCPRNHLCTVRGGYRQRDLFAACVHYPKDLINLEKTSHNTIILDQHAVEKIAQLVNSGDTNAA